MRHVQLHICRLLERFPTLYNTLELGIPGESGNGVPDLLEQALWLVDSYRLLGQRADGAVSGGFETLSHPHFGDISTHQSQPYFCYAPGRFSTLHYAATAAQAARLLAPFDASRSAAIAASARLAFAWAEANTAVPTCTDFDIGLLRFCPLASRQCCYAGARVREIYISFTAVPCRDVSC